VAKRNPQSGLLERIAHASPNATPNPRDILSSLGGVVYDWDLISDQLRWGPNVGEVLGFSAQNPIETGAAYAERIAPESGAPPQETILRSRENDLGSGVKYQLHYSLALGSEAPRRLWVEDVGRWFAGPNGRPARAHGVLRVVNCMTSAETVVAPVNHDPLTGALSRSRFVELSTRMFNEAARNRVRCGLLLIAIDGLAAVNQLYGYEIADQLIAGAGRRLRGLLRAGDLIARYAGNKFAVAIAACDAEQLAVAARRCIEGVAEASFDTDAGPIRATLRAGGVVTPHYPNLGQSAFLHAEEALEAARTAGGPRFVAYEPNAMRESARQQNRKLAEQIVAALNDKRISIALEPIVDAASGRVAFYEALMRMRLDNGAALAPSVAFCVAEKAGLAPLLDQRVLELALARLAECPDLSLSVNMSGLTAREPDWPGRTRATFARFPGCAERLIVEITETCAIEDIEATRRTIGLLKDIGARVAMDDFGAGHTSFRNLRNLRLDLIKIDGAFVQNLAHSPDDRFFVRTLIELARHVNVPTVAEWVTDEESARLLRDWGVSYFQGELFGRAETFEPAARAEEAAA
jgi:diguanylate cyclase (GGDEF)-like protein